MVKQSITVGHLYPKQMNVYGDIGNVIALRYRLEARDIGCNYIKIESLKQLNSTPVDIVIGGGGQDSNQEFVQHDLKTHGDILRAQCRDGLVCLMVCGMYQLFGRTFITNTGEKISGLGILDIETSANDERLIGNITVNSPWGKLVGFENHSGRTILGPDVTALGSVTKGAGNNGTDKTEGAVFNNIFGTYMHGPLLAKNTEIADELITRALTRKYSIVAALEQLDDTLEALAVEVAAKRPR